jgi:hypothetical protein
MELLRSEYCIHFRGDTTTSRRVYDAIAAGCVPVIISDNTHVPFTSSLNWNAFTVTIPERVLLQVCFFSSFSSYIFLPPPPLFFLSFNNSH